MENIQEYLESGILELYVYGALPEAEREEVTRVLREYPELRQEVEQIEEALQELSGAAAPYDPQDVLISLKKKIRQRPERTPEFSKKKNISAILGWAASIILLIGLFMMYDANTELNERLTEMEQEQADLETQIVEAREDSEKTEQLLRALRSRNIEKIPLQGQDFAPEAYATAYWNKAQNITYIDAQDLPAPPPGMVYQVWSLKLDPLTPSSIGLLEDFEGNSKRIFIVDNSYDSEAFGITLEPAGGSETPTLEKLMVLGTVTIT
ncbi:Anti-sigma-K factor rskA [Salinimicrobium sediminis]|uniref:Regulator of SigK n=1 Tax=Salinimicrobium sediminis TaxID=1343891 RepID=A0A285X8A2_9FLAO|nr:anti-sigma factor [Salinimicrobium sediminis]SOC81577.1 Anti-sigma-K factor rskA [Salinimicrobium sediminis]